MAKFTATGFIQHEIVQGLILGNPRALLPQGLSRWWCDTTDNDITDLAFGMAGHDVNDLVAAHLRYP